MSNLKVIQLELGSMANFNYIIADTLTAEAAVVDPGDEVNTLLQTAQDNGLALTSIILTHGHYDHVGGAERICYQMKIPVYISRLEAPMYIPKCQNLKKIEPDEILKIGGLSVKAIHTPGHTPGCVCFLVEDNLITGDTLFVDAIGRTDLPGGSAIKLFRSLQEIKKLPDNTNIWPGHNYGAVPHETLGVIKRTNPYLICNDEKEFLELAG